MFYVSRRKEVKDPIIHKNEKTPLDRASFHIRYYSNSIVAGGFPVQS